MHRHCVHMHTPANQHFYFSGPAKHSVQGTIASEYKHGSSVLVSHVVTFGGYFGRVALCFVAAFEQLRNLIVMVLTCTGQATAFSGSKNISPAGRIAQRRHQPKRSHHEERSNCTRHGSEPPRPSSHALRSMLFCLASGRDH